MRPSLASSSSVPSSAVPEPESYTGMFDCSRPRAAFGSTGKEKGRLDRELIRCLLFELSGAAQRRVRGQNVGETPFKDFSEWRERKRACEKDTPRS
ncbi:hypothetical protein MRX96_007081 [Rhipicephalus microplus]